MEEDLDRNTQVAVFLTLVAFGLAVVVGTASTLVVPFLYKGLNRPAITDKLFFLCSGMNGLGMACFSAAVVLFAQETDLEDWMQYVFLGGVSVRRGFFKLTARPRAVCIRCQHACGCVRSKPENHTLHARASPRAHATVRLKPVSGPPLLVRRVCTRD